MATTGQSAEYALYAATPPLQPSAKAYGARLHRYRATVTLASQAAGEVQLMHIPPGQVFCFGVLNTSASLGSSTVAIGVTGTVGKYRAAAVFTATDTPTLFGVNAAVADAGHTDNTAGAVTDVFLTVATASLPASGTLVVDLYFSGV